MRTTQQTEMDLAFKRMGAAFTTGIARSAHYVSDSCIHEDHIECRLTCPECSGKCRCECHIPKAVHA